MAYIYNFLYVCINKYVYILDFVQNVSKWLRFYHPSRLPEWYEDLSWLPGKTERRFRAEFHLFSAHFPPMVPHMLFFHPHVYGFCLFLPIFHLKWYPLLVINSSMVTNLPFFRPHIYGFCLFSTYAPSAHFPPVLSCRVIVYTVYCLHCHRAEVLIFTNNK